jgi:hypothetical protein
MASWGLADPAYGSRLPASDIELQARERTPESEGVGLGWT